MQPEDIDKLFRDRLANHAPTPPAFLWAEIEAEIQPRRKRPVLWLAAAAVTLLTLLGGAWWVLTGTGPGRPGQPEVALTLPPSTTPAASQNISSPQATTPPATPSSPIETPAAEPAPVVATTEPFRPATSEGVQPDQQRGKRQLNRPRAAASQQLALASTPAPTAPTPSRPTLPERGPDPELARPTELPTATVALTGPIEVEVRHTEAPAAVASAEPERRPRLSSLLRQARNAVKGERVSLTEAGLPESVTVQAHVAGRTLVKTIQL